MNTELSDPLLTTPPAPQGQASGLSKRRKAAMIVQMMIAQGRSLSLQNLPEDVQLSLTRELGTMRIVDRSTLHAVADEFSEILDQIGMAAPGSLDNVVEVLSDTISPEAAARIKSEEAARRIALDPWAQITRLEIDDLIPIMDEEATEVSAVVLSKLPVAKAATLLGKLPGDRARQVTFAVNQTREILPDAVRRIGQAIAQTHCMKPTPAFGTGADARVGAILDSSGASTRDGVLEGLDTEDPKFADDVRKAIFTFADISTRVRGLDIPNVTRAVNADSLITAMTFALSLGGNEAEAAEFILSNMSQRMADQLREDIGDRGKIRKSDGEAAMKSIITAIRDSVDAGEMQLVELDEEEED